MTGTWDAWRSAPYACLCVLILQETTFFASGMYRDVEVCAIKFFSEMRNRSPNRNSRFQALLVISLFVFLAVTSRAQEYGFDLWTTANGLPQNTVTGVVQTPDGYLWVSTFDGL